MAFLGKTGLILSAGMLLAGGILFSIGAANGGIGQVEAMAVNGELSIGGTHFFYPNRHSHSATWATAEEAVVVSEVPCEEAAQVVYLEDLESDEIGLEQEEGIAEIAKKEDVEELVIDLKSANGELNLYLTSSDSFYMIPEDFTYELNGSTLKISPKEVYGGYFYIPEDWVGKRIEISAGAGYVYAENLYADEIKVNVGAGYMCVESVQAETLDLALGTGSLELYEVLTEDAEIEIGMGSAYITDGMIAGDLNVDCGMGELIMNLNGRESDHNYKVSSAGSLSIGNYNHSGVHNHYEIDNHVSSDFSITCGLGSIGIYFEE